MLHVLDPHERTFPYDGLTAVRVRSSPQHKLLVNPAAIRTRLPRRAWTRSSRAAASSLAGAGVDYHLALTDAPLEATLLELLVARVAASAGRQRGAS